ncbi:MAG: hypothetical protein HC909_01340 [Blastochloris sp.]|nr:hypothetical protein [Blastochloris sp.]
MTIGSEGDDLIIEAAVVAERFGLTVDELQQELRTAGIVTFSEVGEGEDAGRRRLNFRRGTLLWRFVLHADGSVTEDPVVLQPKPLHRQRT